MGVFLIQIGFQGGMKEGSSVLLDPCLTTLDWTMRSRLNFTDFHCDVLAVACRALVLRLKECRAIALVVLIAAEIFLFVHLVTDVNAIVQKFADRLDIKSIAEKPTANMLQAPKVDSTTGIVTEDLGKEKSMPKKS